MLSRLTVAALLLLLTACGEAGPLPVQGSGSVEPPELLGADSSRVPPT